MAQLYGGEQFWTDRVWEMTACSKPGCYSTRKEFINAVNTWMDQHKITYKWSGESTHEHDGIVTYQYHVRIAEKKMRTLFALRWSE